ncbi:hypothetical protein [Frankia nepalensis]|uniref:Uncharacterized protein n=2 Tax=Frankia nepalensis TaxID=1836974 RepID=A0A937RIE5_9ACTN|nr:hypothetical protein [Frankia nepalensis]MBL7494855.1 hypothetical protein [Frankia nepalensis]MBL7512209.1 hypothetical protein [Frankia nepalensis]MBL7626576.1 hypothetical protein [Frankia nepalensis]
MIVALTLSPRIVAELHTLIKNGDVAPAQLARRAPTLVASLTGRRTPTAATDAHRVLLAAVESLPAVSRDAARALLAINAKPRTTLTTRRTLASKYYGVGADRFARAYEDDVITALALALAERADPNATLPSGRPRFPPPPFRALRRRTA